MILLMFYFSFKFSSHNIFLVSSYFSNIPYDFALYFIKPIYYSLLSRSNCVCIGIEQVRMTEYII